MQAWHAFRNTYVTYAHNAAASAAQSGGAPWTVGPQTLPPLVGHLNKNLTQGARNGLCQIP